jgi:hypothetical protein
VSEKENRTSLLWFRYSRFYCTSPQSTSVLFLSCPTESMTWWHKLMLSTATEVAFLLWELRLLSSPHYLLYHYKYRKMFCHECCVSKPNTVFEPTVTTFYTYFQFITIFLKGTYIYVCMCVILLVTVRLWKSAFSGLLKTKENTWICERLSGEWLLFYRLSHKSNLIGKECRTISPVVAWCVGTILGQHVIRKAKSILRAASLWPRGAKLCGRSSSEGAG